MTSWRIVRKVQGSMLIVILLAIPIVVRGQANDATTIKNNPVDPYKIVETNDRQ